MEVDRQLFGHTEEGREVGLYTLSQRNGFEVRITDFGGIITSLKAPDFHGNYENVVLGFDNLDDYLRGHPYFGAVIGRYANRIAEGVFNLDGREYRLSRNNNGNHLHGGHTGFDKVLWDSEVTEENSLRLRYESRDGEEGYPGTLRVSVTFSLTGDNELTIRYRAVTDKATPVNLTSHSYFNLKGIVPATILGHELKLKSSLYTPVNESLIPTGELRPGEDTPFDFTRLRTIGERIEHVDGGYDHNYVLDKPPGGGSAEPALGALLREPKTGRQLRVYTTEPGIQFYSGNFLNGNEVSPAGFPYEQYAGVCLEPQHFPDSPNHPDFPSTLLRPGETYRSTTVYRFSTEENG